MSSRRRVWPLVVTALVLLAGGGAAGVAWYVRGPGLEREAARLLAVAEMQRGMVAGEIGAGQGALAARVARRLGESGRVYATELEAADRDGIRRTAVAAGLLNVEVLQAGRQSTNLPVACCDLIYMRRVFHHLDDPSPILESVKVALRPGGRFAVIDFLTPRWMFWTRHGIAAEGVVAAAARHGFELERRVNRWSPIDYCLVFRVSPVRP